MSRLGATGAVVPLLTDTQTEVLFHCFSFLINCLNSNCLSEQNDAKLFVLIFLYSLFWSNQQVIFFKI